MFTEWETPVVRGAAGTATISACRRRTFSFGTTLGWLRRIATRDRCRAPWVGVGRARRSPPFHRILAPRAIAGLPVGIFSARGLRAPPGGGAAGQRRAPILLVATPVVLSGWPWPTSRRAQGP